MRASPASPSRSSRRDLLRSGVALVAAMGPVSACSWLSTTPETKKEPPRVVKGKEAPALAERVKQGKLPALEKRLPARPMVLEPVERVGIYGGTWDTTILGPSDTAWLDRTVGYENLVRWDTKFERVIPNVAERYNVTDDGRTFVFHLRAGLKWSDGTEFTAADVAFAYDDYLLNKQLFPELRTLYVSGDKPARLEVLDDHSFQFVFSEPQSLFLYNLATPYAAELTMTPRHYLEQFHAKYNDKAALLAAQRRMSDWSQLFLAQHDAWTNPALPRLHAWLPTNTFDEDNRLVLERNPYYFKVDPDGSQLPYIDSVVYAVVGDPQVMILKATNGDIDMQDRSINDLENKPVLARERDKGDYRLSEEVPTNSNTLVISLNLTHRDPVKREIFQNRDFRVGLSYAINRQEIINAAYQRQGEPYQAAPRPDSPYYDEELAKQYTEFDLARANEHLDRAGYRERDDDNFRRGPDGERITFAVDVRPEVKVQVSGLDMIRATWRQVGIDMRVNSVSRALFEERRLANQHDATVWDSEGGGLLEPILRTDWYFPSGVESINYAPLWLSWYQTQGGSGEEPPAPVREQMELYDDLKATNDQTRRDEMMKRILQISKEYFYHIGTSLIAPTFAVVKNTLRNVPESMPSSFIFSTPVSVNPQQWYFSE